VPWGFDARSASQEELNQYWGLVSACPFDPRTDKIEITLGGSKGKQTKKTKPIQPEV